MVQFKTPPQQHFCMRRSLLLRLWVSLNFKNDGHFSRLMKRCNEHKSGRVAATAALFQRGDERTSERAGFSSIPPLYIYAYQHSSAVRLGKMAT